ncbi:hypothetical protein [Erythrobacter sp.]|jgi:hypothetical protein|uniref:hypothetical protein n=1 Tax=Erythrobacter sp. TaxID=1042 RepID=UPI002EC96CF0|nr:hypothetical protein [Erythrobacter sp.]
MVRGGTIALAAGALLATPVLAQDGAAPSEGGFTPEDDLDCALYVGALMAESEAELTPDSRTALTGAFTYFVGRYEAKRGTRLAEAFAARYAEYQNADPTQIAQTCSVRMRSFGGRLERLRQAQAVLPSGE